MDLPVIPAPDEVVIAILQVLGVSGGVVTLVGTAYVLHSWYEQAKKAVSASRVVRRAASRSASTLVAMRPVQVITAFLTSIFVPAAQLLTLGLVYLGGNYLSMIIHTERWLVAVQVVSDDPWGSWHPDRLAMFLTLDWIVLTYLALASGVLVASYMRVNHSPNMLGAVLALPATALLLLGLPMGVLTLGILLFGVAVGALVWMSTGELDTHYLVQMLTALLPMVIGLGVCAAYYGACQAAVRASRLLFNVWRH